MDVNEYQLFTRTTAIYPREKAIEYLALGLVSEAGEVAGKIKKLIRDGSLNSEDMLSELGDVLWYVARLADELAFDLDVVIDYNEEKLQSRKDRNELGGSGDHR